MDGREIVIAAASDKKHSGKQEKAPGKKHSRRIVFALVIMLPIILLAGCLNLSDEKTFTTADVGLSITLTSRFVEQDLAVWTAYYSSTTSIVTVLKEEFHLFDQHGHDAADLTPEDYARLVIESNREPCDVEKVEGLTTFTYERRVNGKDFKYFAVTFKGPDAFWLVQFGCDRKNFDKFQAQFIEWAKTVKVL
ncbi:MAG: hypothetical protein FWE85_02220 [Clostridiales bacterium]|nr:hypothetical protein [Clostridiales bacterium]